MGDLSASRCTKPTEMRARLFETFAIIIKSVRSTKIVVEVVFVHAAMERFRAGLRLQLHLATAATVEVGGLIGRGNLEFRNACYGNGNNSRRGLVETRAVHSASASGRVGAERPDVRIVVPAHVIGRVAAVKLEGVLVARKTTRVAVDILAGLED